MRNNSKGNLYKQAVKRWAEVAFYDKIWSRTLSPGWDNGPTAGRDFPTSSNSTGSQVKSSSGHNLYSPIFPHHSNSTGSQVKSSSEHNLWGPIFPHHSNSTGHQVKSSSGQNRWGPAVPQAAETWPNLTEFIKSDCKPLASGFWKTNKSFTFLISIIVTWGGGGRRQHAL